MWKRSRLKGPATEGYWRQFVEWARAAPGEHVACERECSAMSW
jgi:hypothetical protein